MKRNVPTPMFLASGAVIGAVLAIAFDPTSGRRRRALTRDRVVGVTNRGVKQMERLGRTIRAQSIGLSKRLWHRVTSTPREVGPLTLVNRVESEVFREVDIPPGRVLVDSEHDAIVLRGALDDQGQIDELIRAVSRIPGVTKVESLLHLEGTPAPNKVAAIEASDEGQIAVDESADMRNG